MDYFRQLGVGDLYFSPVFQARARSPHGYDVTNPGQFNREVGDEAEFAELSAGLRARGMGLVLDIVPNHMAASEDNPWWRDILEHGPASVAAHFFDVEWYTDDCNGRIVLPVLGQDLRAALAAHELRLAYRENGLVLTYYARTFPLDPGTYGPLLRTVEGIDASLPAGADAIGRRAETTAGEKAERRRAGMELKERLAAWVAGNGNRARLEQALAAFPAAALKELMRRQAYMLEFWRTGAVRINYRRFFDITDLAGVRVEDSDVFAVMHSLILELVRTDQIDGVRVDHIDGLRDPYAYMHDLRKALGDTYVLVEKILAPKEELRENWPIEGTTGYDFVGVMAGFFCEPDGLNALIERYHQCTGMPSFAELVYQKKKHVIRVLFPGELRALAGELGRVAARLGVALPAETLAACLTEVSASLEVYRTYVAQDIDGYDRCVLKQAITAARHRAPEITDDVYGFMRRILLKEDIPEAAERVHADFLANWQQFTGPVMAKGLEDTAFYNHHALLALCEVGARPDGTVASSEQLHEILARRARRWPYTLNASSTHDTKRSEDVRARLQVITEMPGRWQKLVAGWIERHARYQQNLAGSAERFPRVNEQLLIYQTLLGVWPLHEREEAGLPDRLRAFLQKAAREAKDVSSWRAPNEAYEKTLSDFTEHLLADDEFRRELRALHEDISWFGALNSLSQLVIKLTAPGIPDVYQGNESWLYALVDPDNRRPVDFQALAAQLASLPDPITPARATELLRDWPDGRIKMHVTRAGLQLRRSKLQLMANGDYVPISARGRFARNVVAFARRRENEWVLTITGRFYSHVARAPLGAMWGDTALELPADAPRAWTNLLTGEVSDGSRLEGVFATLPFALLVATT